MPRTCRLLNGKMLDILMAKEVIAINQDPLGVAGDRVWKVGPAEVRSVHFAWLAGPDCLLQRRLLKL